MGFLRHENDDGWDETPLTVAQQAPRRTPKQQREKLGMPPAKQTDTTEGIEIAGISLPANVVLTNGSSSLMLGNAYSNGMGVSGLVERMLYLPGGAIRVFVGEKRCLIFPTGMMAEEK